MYMKLPGLKLSCYFDLKEGLEQFKLMFKYEIAMYVL